MAMWFVNAMLFNLYSYFADICGNSMFLYFCGYNSNSEKNVFLACKNFLKIRRPRLQKKTHDCPDVVSIINSIHILMLS